MDQRPEQDPSDSHYENSDNFLDFPPFPHDLDPIWPIELDEILSPNDAAQGTFAVDDESESFFTPAEDFSVVEPLQVEAPILNEVSQSTASNAIGSAVVKVEPAADLLEYMQICSHMDTELSSSSSIENYDPQYYFEKVEPDSDSCTPESPIQIINPLRSGEYHQYEDRLGQFPEYCGWHVILETPYGTLLSEKKIPVGKVMYARNRLVYVWLPQKHFDKSPVLLMGELNMPSNHCGSLHSLCFKRPYAKVTTQIAPVAPTEFFICMDPSVKCRSNAHKSTDATVILTVCADSVSRDPLAHYHLAVGSYDSQAKSGRFLSGILCFVFLLSGAAGHIWRGSFNGAAGSSASSTGRMLMNVEEKSPSQPSHGSRIWSWLSSASDTIGDLFMSSGVGELLLSLMLLTSVIALVKWIDLKATARSIKEQFVSGRLWQTLFGAALFYLIVWRCYTSATSPSLNSLTGVSAITASISVVGFNLSPITLAVLLFSAQYLLGGDAQSPVRAEEEETEAAHRRRAQPELPIEDPVPAKGRVIIV